ncbi:hypothetical protein GALL_546640 [mine drainage metagenome]|uniref:Uncharacterized protein n=1 Tax=mine drainage metagenome TaxID=410659 RepID=A0A1J5PEX1_9ZZZZ
MRELLRHRLLGIVLTLLVGLGPSLGVYAQRMTTLDDLAVASFAEIGGTAGDLCGKGANHHFPDGGCQWFHASVDAVLPPQALVLRDVAFDETVANFAPLATVAALVPLDLGRGSRGPPAAFI